MIFKWLKRGVIVAAGLALVGGLAFGTDLLSYARSSAKTVRTAVKGAIPTEFELRRARDLLEDIIPEMQANIRLIAQEEVEIAALKADIGQSHPRVARERGKIEDLTRMLSVERAAYQVGESNFSRREVKDDLARRFDRFKEAELVLAGKQRLLEARGKSLRAAMQVLERTRAEKVLLEEKIAALEAQHRLVQAASVGSRIQVNQTKLAQAKKLIAQVKNRLDVAERVLAHEARFTEPIATDTISEKELLAQVREHFEVRSETVALAPKPLASERAGDNGGR